MQRLKACSCEKRSNAVAPAVGGQSALAAYKGYKRVALQPEGYTDIRGLVKVYGEIFNVH